jgi:uncharacterized membrane protein
MKFDFGDLIKESWDKLSKSLVKWALFFLVGMLLAMTIILIPTVARGITKATLDFIRTGKDPEFGELWNFEGFLQTTLLILVAGGLIFLGSIVVIPGIILGVWWFYSLFFMVDKNMEFWDAMSASKEAVSRTGFWNHLILIVIYNVLISVGGSVCGLGACITGPLGMLILGYAYLQMTGEKAS